MTGDKEAASQELEKEQKPQKDTTSARPERRSRTLFLVFHSNRSGGEV